MNQTTFVYMIAGLFYAFVFTLAMMATAHNQFYLSNFLWLLCCYSFPTVVVVVLVNPAIRMRTVVGYLIVVLFVAVLPFEAFTYAEAIRHFQAWLATGGPGILLVSAFLNRRVRSVGPLVFLFSIMAFTGAFLIFNGIKSSDGLMRLIVNAGSGVGLQINTIFVLLFVPGFVLFGYLGWSALQWLGHQYKEKRMSDQSIMLNALWLLFSLVQAIGFVFSGWAWVFTGVAAFAVCRVIVYFGLKYTVRKNRNMVETPVLLFLRVFSLGKRSEHFFDSISKVWLYSGSISLISGPDLATTTVEPHEFLDFMGGRLSRQFVKGEKDLEERLSAMDLSPDPDGRYRVNEFFCPADTWQMNMRQLALGSASVLMDLRSFSKTNQGCIYELQQLMNTIPLERLIFSIDDSTDRVFLETTVKDIWHSQTADSPNADLSNPVVRLFMIRKQSFSEINQLMETLFSHRATA